MDLKVHVYRLHDDGPVSEELDEECDVSAANHWILPSGEYSTMLHVKNYNDLDNSNFMHMINLYEFIKTGSLINLCVLAHEFTVIVCI